MKEFIGSAFVGAGLAAAALSLAATASAESAVNTIGQLEAQGFDVKLDRVGSAPLNQCDVINVRNPRERTELVRVGGRATAILSRSSSNGSSPFRSTARADAPHDRETCW